MSSAEPGRDAAIDRELHRAWRRLYFIWAACTAIGIALILLS